MAVSLNSVISFSPSARHEQVMRNNSNGLLLRVPFVTYLSRPAGLRQSTEGRRTRFCILASSGGGDYVATETTDKDSENIEASYSEDGSSANGADVSSSATDGSVRASGKDGSTHQVSQVSNGSAPSTNPNQEGSVAKPNSTLKRSPLTARERLRAARVLSRYTESSKSSKPEFGSKLLETLQETDKGKRRSGLPEAPTNLFDDSKRGLPKEGWTINLPGGMSVFFVIFSFVFITSVMFATTYLVWKVGAIHFNEY